jgi:hypothetical protein
LSRTASSSRPQAQLGHRDPATTLRHYAHATPLDDLDVADAIDQRLNELTGGERWRARRLSTSDDVAIAAAGSRLARVSGNAASLGVPAHADDRVGSAAPQKDLGFSSPS